MNGNLENRCPENCGVSTWLSLMCVSMKQLNLDCWLILVLIKGTRDSNTFTLAYNPFVRIYFMINIISLVLFEEK